LTRLREDARLALRRDELHAEGRNSKILSRAKEHAELTLDEHSRLVEKKRQQRNLVSLSIWALMAALWHDLGGFKGAVEQEDRLVALRKEKEQLQGRVEDDVEQHGELARLHQEACLKHKGVVSGTHCKALWEATYSMALRTGEYYVRVSMKVHSIERINLEIEMLRMDIWELDVAKRREKGMADFMENSNKADANPGLKFILTE
jgi:hypothetical protein